MEYAEVLSRCLLLTVFLVSSAGKARKKNFRRFEESVRAMRVTPRPLAGAAARLAVLAEAAVAVLLAVPSGAATLAGMALALAFLAAATAAIVVAGTRGTRVPCRCFGRPGAVLGPRHVARNAVLMLAGAAGAASLAGGQGAGLAGGTLLLAASTGVVLACLLMSMDQLVELFAQADRGTRVR